MSERPILTFVIAGVTSGIAMLMGGKMYVTYKIAEAMESEKYYTKTMELFDNYKVGVEQVGTPYKAKRLFIQDTERNWTDRMNARLLIQLKGAQSGKAFIHTWAHKCGTPPEWQVDKCDLEVNKKRWTFYINPLSKDVFTVTEMKENFVEEYPPGWIKSAETRERLGIVEENSDRT